MNFTMMKFRAMMLCLLVMLFAGSLISCSSDDDDSPKRETPTEDTEVQLIRLPANNITNKQSIMALNFIIVKFIIDNFYC
jgi:hypothetical protein